MAGSTRDDVWEAKLALTEQRVETRLVEIESRIDRVSGELGAKLDRVLDRVNVSVESSERAQKAAERAEDRADEARRAASTTKWNILFTAIGVVATLLAAWAIWSQGIEMVASIFAAKGGT